MGRSDDERLADIMEAAREVSQIVAAGHDAYRGDRIGQFADERLMEIIGESARAMSEDGRNQYPTVPWSDIVGLRTLLAHHYHRVDPEQVWVIAADILPTLARVLAEG